MTLAFSPAADEVWNAIRRCVTRCASSLDLLDDDERSGLCRCSVFAGGFDLAAAAQLNDEYTMLDVLDSLVRKSLVTVNQSGGHARYGLLQTIRQYAEDHLAATYTISEVRDRHAGFYAAKALAWWNRGGEPGYSPARRHRQGSQGTASTLPTTRHRSSERPSGHGFAWLSTIVAGNGSRISVAREGRQHAACTYA